MKIIDLRSDTVTLPTPANARILLGDEPICSGKLENI